MPLKVPIQARLVVQTHDKTFPYLTSNYIFHHILYFWSLPIQLQLKIWFLICSNIPPSSCSKFLIIQKRSFSRSLQFKYAHKSCVDFESLSHLYKIRRIFYHAWVGNINRWWYNQRNERYGYLYGSKNQTNNWQLFTPIFRHLS